MLLNQCLAISLFALKKDEQQEIEVTSSIKPEKEPSKAALLFDRLIEENLGVLVDEQENEEEKETSEKWKLQVNHRDLLEALKRVEFAGFVVPSWLLLSGTFNDLYCIKANWLNGNFRPPIGYKIETIGNIRSVNVDYSEANERISRRDHIEARSATSFSLTSNILSKRSSSSGSERNSPQFAPLDSAILVSLSEICKRTQKNTIHVSTLIEHLDTKYKSHIDLPAIKFVDCALNGLLRFGKLTLQSLNHEQMETILLSSNERARQSVFVDQLFVIVDNNSNDDVQQTVKQNSSKSTTLDSGIKSWDLGTGRVQEARSSTQSSPINRTSPSKNGFSLWRSLSFKGKQRPILQTEKWQQHSSSPEQDSSPGYLPVKNERLLQNHQEKGKTLSGLFRSKSVRCIRNTHSMRRLNMHERQVERTQVEHQSATIDYLTSATSRRGGSMFMRNGEQIRTNGIVLFLRKLFVNRKSSKYAYDESEQVTSYEMGDERSKRREATEIEQVIIERTSQPVHLESTGTTTNQSLSDSPLSSSADSSGSNSLIEILDCSPSLNSSRRPLREETICTVGNLNRAIRRTLVKRSNSSLSQNSQVSCSTTKSNVSQQLRRHLDEAYKRHRNCTSQRERDFIDSINVLRQASRHVIQQSVRSRQISKRTSTKSSASELDTTRSNSLSSNCHTSNTTKNNNNNISHRKISQNSYQTPRQEKDLIDREKVDSKCLNCRELSNTDANGNVSLPSTAAIESSLSNCCLCNSYLANTKLCPLFSCSTTTACCLIAQQQQQHQQQQLQMRPPYSIRMAAQMPDPCCPLWHSLLYGYCQPLWPGSTLPVPGHQSSLESVEKLVTSQQLQQQQQQQQQLHQHQHNTTIDLKIEIGAADFVKREEGVGNEEELVIEPTDDSLDSDQTSDESLNKLTGFESEQNNDSLEAEILSTVGD